MGVQAFRYPYLGIYVNSFCLDAGETDILIDSGLVSGRKHLAPFAKKTTALLCTHGHWDHIGNHRFLVSLRTILTCRQREEQPLWKK